MEKSDACVVQNKVLSQKEQKLKNTLYGHRGPSTHPPQTPQTHFVPPHQPTTTSFQAQSGAVPQAIVLPAESQQQIASFLRGQDESMREQIAHASFPHQVLMQQAQTMQSQTSLLRQQQEQMLAHMNNVYNAQTVAHNQLRNRYEVQEDNRRILNEVIGPLKAAIANSQAQTERQEQKTQMTQFQLERLIEATNEEKAVNQILLKQQKGAADIVTSVAMKRAGLGAEEPRSVLELGQCSKGMEEIQNQIKSMSQEIVQLGHIADSNYTRLLERKVKTQELAMGGDIADSLKERDRRIEGLLGSVFDYVGFSDEMMELESQRKKIAEEFYKMEKIEIQTKEVTKRAYYDYEVPQIKLRQGRAKEIEVKGKRIPAHLRDIATVPQECPVEEYKPVKGREETILDGSGSEARRVKKGSARAGKSKTERGRATYTREVEPAEEEVIQERSEAGTREVRKGSIQRIEEIRREDRGPTQLLKLKRLVIEDIKRDIEQRQEEESSLPTVQFDEVAAPERGQEEVYFKGASMNESAVPPSAEIMKKVREEMSQSFSEKHKEEEKLVDLLTDKIIEKMLTGEEDPNASVSSTSGELVKKLVRELEAKGVALDQFVREEPQNSPYLSIPAPVVKKESGSRKEDKGVVTQPVRKEERKVEVKEEVKDVEGTDFMSLISRKALHQRKPQPRIDINLEDQKLKLEAEQELLRRQMPINAAPFVAQASNIGMSAYQNPFCIGAPSQLPKQPIHIGPLEDYELSSADGLSEMWEEDDSLGAGIHIDNPRVIRARVQKQQMATIETNKRTIESEPLIEQQPKAKGKELMTVVRMGDVMASTESFGPRKVTPPQRSMPHEVSNEDADLESGELPEHMFRRN